MPLQTWRSIRPDFSGAAASMRNALAGVQGAQNAIQSEMGRLQKEKDDARKQQLLAEELKQREFQNELAKQRAGIQEQEFGLRKQAVEQSLAEKKQKQMQDEELSKLLMTINPTYKDKVTVKGNSAKVEAAKQANQALDAEWDRTLSNQPTDNQTKAYDSILANNLTQYLNDRAKQPNEGGNVSTASNIHMRPTERLKMIFSGRNPHTKGRDHSKVYQTESAKPVYNNEEVYKAVQDDKLYKALIKKAGLTPEEEIKLQNEAATITKLKQYGDKLVSLSQKQKKEVPELVPDNYKTVTKKRSNAELRDILKQNILKDDKLNGSAKLAAVAKINELYPEKQTKQPSLSELLTATKYRDKKVQENSQLKAWHDSKVIPDYITSMEGAKEYFKSRGKSSKGKKYDFVTDLALGATGNDAEDVKHLQKLASNPKAMEMLNKMTPAQQQRIAALIKAQYKNESSLDLTDWGSDSAFRDALEEVASGLYDTVWGN